MIKTLADLDSLLKTKLSKNLESSSVKFINKETAEEQIKLKKNTRTDGFTSPTKTAKKQKVLQNYSVGAISQIKISNQYQALAGSSALPAQDITVVPHTKYPPSI
ncbi:hypothetical protein TNIN_349431 [Trichonephila inaurata madagascariensis]|uniref:Uncharacterized protein n=1 Tax=Trichonephila inaurata madagascariensis TaxID=2747483 RepID=A0A8X7CKZ9_9ARAC|nr:hypothetical protein TNIN_349431 [Trichonephila inaurata madagascariensis]